MKTKLLVIFSILVALAVILAVFGWYWMGRPMYRPGTLAATLREPPPQPDDEHYWAVDQDVRLYHYADGSGPNVLVVHGGPGHPMHTPPPGLKSLADRRCFHYYDQRGCGNSSRPVDRFASANFYENMLAVNAALGLGAQVSDIEKIRRILKEEKLVLIGHSFGGFLAALYAAEFPQQVKALVLVAPADLLVLPQKGGGLFERVRASLPAGMQPAYAAYLKRYLNFSGIFALSDAELTALNAEFARYYAAAAAARGFATPAAGNVQGNGGWMVQAMYLSMGRRHDYRAALRRVQAPVLVIHGSRDFQTEAESRAYTRCFPHARFATIPNAGHFPFTDRPEEFAAVTGQFLRELD
jgi:proline iminopeptidase